MIIYIAWIRISNFQMIRKESMRRVAIEVASGYLDVMATRSPPAQPSYYVVQYDPLTESYQSAALGTDETIQPLFDPIPEVVSNELAIGGMPAWNVTTNWYHPPIGYTLQATNRPASGGWPTAWWAIITLYDKHSVAPTNAGVPFSRLSLFMK